LGYALSEPDYYSYTTYSAPRYAGGYYGGYRSGYGSGYGGYAGVYSNAGNDTVYTTGNVDPNIPTFFREADGSCYLVNYRADGSRVLTSVPPGNCE